MKTWVAVVLTFVLSESAVHATTTQDYFPLGGGNSWTWSRSHPSAALAPWTATVVQSTNGMAWVVGLPGMENGVWLAWAGMTLYAWNPSEGAWKTWLRFGAATKTSYVVYLGTPMWNATKVTVSSRTARIKSALLGKTFYDCVRFSFTSLNPDAGMVVMHFAPGIGLVHWSKRSGLTPTSGEIQSAVLGGKKFGKVLHTVALAGPDANTAIPDAFRTKINGPGGSPFMVVKNAELWEIAKKGFTNASQIPVIDWEKQTVLIVRALHVFNSNASIVIEDVQWDFQTQEAFVTARLKSPKESQSSLWYSPYAIIVTEEKVPHATWHLKVD